MARPEPSAPVLQAALKFLRPRERFAEEVRAHLRAKGFADDDVESVVRYLSERRLVNDDRTTQNLVERNTGKRAVGIERLRVELERLGAPAETVEARIAAMGQSEAERALEALRWKYRSGADRAKAGRFLIARGFQEDAVESALDAFCGSTPFPE